MKLLVYVLLANLAHAVPFKLEGIFKVQDVSPLASIQYEIANSAQQAEIYKSLGFTCKKVDSRYSCRKLEYVQELPQAVSNQLKDQAPQVVEFQKTEGDYSLVNDAESFKQWSIFQIVMVDKVRFKNLMWNEIQNGPTKIVISHDEITHEFLVQNNAVGSVQKMTYQNPKSKKITEYWGIVNLVQ